MIDQRWETFKTYDTNKDGVFSKDEFGQFCQKELWEQFEINRPGGDKFDACDFTHMSKVLNSGITDIDPDHCWAKILARPDGVWAPVGFGSYVCTQHSILMIWFGLGIANDNSRWYGRVMFSVLLAMFNLAVSLAGAVTIFDGDNFTQIMTVSHVSGKFDAIDVDHNPDSTLKILILTPITRSAMLKRPANTATYFIRLGVCFGYMLSG